MILDSILEASFRFFNLVYKMFEQYLVNNFVNFGRGFEQIFVMLAVTIFVLITIFILINRVKKLPKSYVIVVLDSLGRKIILKDLRVRFSTYNADISLVIVGIHNYYRYLGVEFQEADQICLASSTSN